MAAEGTPRVVAAISALLERVTERNDATGAGLWSAFRATAKPAISVRAYMARIAEYAAKYADCSPACFVAAYIYLDRHGALAVVDSYSVHRLLITAVLAAHKFLDDKCYKDTNAFFARLGGISLPEMNHLELDFLFRVDFDLNVPPDTFYNYCAMLQFEMLCLQPEALLPLPAAAASGDDGSSQQQRAT